MGVKSLKKLNKFIILFFALAIITAPIGLYAEKGSPSQNPKEVSSFDAGDTILPGMKVVNRDKVWKAPLILHPTNLIEDFKERQYDEVMISILTGVTPNMEKVLGEHISRRGIAVGYEGPGILKIKNGKICVDSPSNFVWGYKVPYTYGVKTKNSLAIVEKNRIVKVVSFSDINNDTVPHDYVSVQEIKKWYMNAYEGENITLDYSLNYFNDNRREVPPNEIEKLFGKNVKEYMKNYPSYSPIMVYMHNYKEKVAIHVVDYLGSYPEYNDLKRELNARSFIKAWNNTIIPPGTASSGKESVGFELSSDPKAPTGTASHGTCPPARALRDAVTSIGFPLPTGLTWEYTAVKYGINPATDIKITNTGKYPIKIIMWSEGHGPSMEIHVKIIYLIPE
ncbi:conserved hypothetical protein [Methanothermus fervidus DSM 2088]|uniref:Uncharacterized protein n=1 Tax=Methanothermus fervidus (strain ATCC 43054 / DSM 2088 / JCM 10308 / V24 S) TaxID=523846 RepID=E3GXV6_METFV|nr:conserved hypothetical protein [Methanothermus fervidus DSM 2088]